MMTAVAGRESSLVVREDRRTTKARSATALIVTVPAPTSKPSSSRALTGSDTESATASVSNTDTMALAGR